MKKNGIIIIVIALILVMIGLLTIYKFNKPVSKEDLINRTLTIIELKNRKKDIVYSDVLDKETYKEEILPDRKEIEYTFYDDKKTIEGKVYLNETGDLYISNDNNYESIRVPGPKFKTMVTDSSDYSNGIYVYLISNDNKLYYFGLLSNNIKNVELKEIPIKFKALSFVDIGFDADKVPGMYKLFVLADDGNIYEAFSGLRYKEDIKSIFDFILAFDDKTMTNQLGNILEDKNGNPYKIKYIFYAEPNKDYIEDDSIIVITEDNRMVTLLYGDSYTFAYEDPIKVVNISFDKNNPFIYGNLKVDFGVETINFEAMCSSYYCINQFDNTDHNIDIDF